MKVSKKIRNFLFSVLILIIVFSLAFLIVNIFIRFAPENINREAAKSMMMLVVFLPLIYAIFKNYFFAGPGFNLLTLFVYFAIFTVLASLLFKGLVMMTGDSSLPLGVSIEIVKDIILLTPVENYLSPLNSLTYAIICGLVTFSIVNFIMQMIKKLYIKWREKAPKEPENFRE